MADREHKNVNQDRRENNRIDAYDVGLRVSNSIDGESLGIIGNLSSCGMMLITRRQLVADGILQLTIDLPREMNAAPIPIGVKILWCTPANSPDEFWVGLRTIDISRAGQASLERLLDQLANTV